MSIAIRDVREPDLDAVLALDNAAGPVILPLEETRLDFFYRHADYFRVGEIDGQLAGFLVAFTHLSPHGSTNFLWFKQHFPMFCYIDRIVIASARRGAGLGRAFYADVTSFAEVRVPQLACDVFLEPRNDVAILFHGTNGFQEIGQRIMPDTQRRVSLLAKELPSYAFVRTAYLDPPATGLPSLAWLAPRQLPSSVTHLAREG